jgi:hypothetical protein
MGGTRVELKSKTGVEPKSKKAPLRIGLLVDGPRASKYAYDLAKWAQDRPDLDITHLIVHAPPATESPASAGKLSKAVRLLQSAFPVRTLAHLAASAMTRVIVMIERILLNRSPRYREHLAEFDLSPIIPNTIVVKPIVSKSGFVYRFADEDVDSLKALSLDPPPIGWVRSWTSPFTCRFRSFSNIRMTSTCARKRRRRSRSGSTNVANFLCAGHLKESS